MENKASNGHSYQDVTISGSAQAHLGNVYNVPVEDPIDKILQQLSFPGMHDWESRSIDAHEGTFGWILKDPQELLDRLTSDLSGQSDTSIDLDAARLKVAQAQKLQDWLQTTSDRTVFWIHGKAGSGKSTLMKTISEHDRTRQLAVRESALDTNVVLLTFFAFKAGSELETRLRGLWRSLLYQLIRSCRTLMTDESSLTGWIATKVPVNSDNGLSKMFIAMLSKAGEQHPIVILLDGLDEITEDEHPDLVANIQQLTKFAKVCVASRTESIFINSFGHTGRDLALHHLTAEDMKTVIRSRLNAAQLTGCSMNAVDMQSMAQKILSRAEGVFIWVDLVVKSLCRGLSNGNDVYFLEDRLDATPKELGSLLEGILYSIEDIYRPCAAWLLLWMSQNEDIAYMPASNLLLKMRAAANTLIGLGSMDLELAEVSAFVHNRFYAIDPFLDGGPDHFRSLDIKQETLLLRACTKDLVGYTRFDAGLGSSNRRLAFSHRTVLDFVLQHQSQLGEWLGSALQEPLFELNSYLRAVQKATGIESFTDRFLRLVNLINRNHGELESSLTGARCLGRILARFDDMGSVLHIDPDNRHWTSYFLDSDVLCSKPELLPRSITSNDATAGLKCSLGLQWHKAIEDPSSAAYLYDIGDCAFVAFLLNCGFDSVFWATVQTCDPEEVSRSKHFWLECATVPIFKPGEFAMLDSSQATVLRLVDEFKADLKLPIPRVYGGSLSVWQRIVDYLLNGECNQWGEQDDDDEWDPNSWPILGIAKALINRGDVDLKVVLPAFCLGQTGYNPRWVDGSTVDVRALVDARIAGELNA